MAMSITATAMDDLSHVSQRPCQSLARVLVYQASV
jgi:hypothetical protein